MAGTSSERRDGNTDKRAKKSRLVPATKLPVDGHCGYCNTLISHCEVGEWCPNKDCGYIDGYIWEEDKRDLTIILTDDITLLQQRREFRFKGLRELTDFIIKRVKGEIGDILLTDECRVSGLIEDYAEEVIKRTKEFDEKHAVELQAATARTVHSS